MDQKANMWEPGMSPVTDNCLDQDPTFTVEDFNRLYEMLSETNNITAGPNSAVGTGIAIRGHALNHGLKFGEKNQYRLTSAMEAQTAGMANLHSNVLQAMDQPAGSSQPLNKSDRKKLAKKCSDFKYRQKQKQEKANQKRKLAESTEEIKVLKDQLASVMTEAGRSAKTVKQCGQDLCQLKGKHDGITTTITEMSKAIIADNNEHEDDIQGTGKKQKKVSTADGENANVVPPPVTSYTIKDVMDDVQALPGIKDNSKRSEFWLQASFCFMDPGHREIYMSIKNPEAKLKWLNIAASRQRLNYSGQRLLLNDATSLL